MPKVFISHARDSHDYARRLGEALRRSWGASSFDEARVTPGKPSRDLVRANLESADYFVVLLTAMAAQSPWLLFELGMAQALRKPVVSLLLGDLDIGRFDFLQLDKWHLDARHLEPEQAAERIRALAEGAGRGSPG